MAQRPGQRRRIKDVLTRDLLWQLYVEERMTDAEIAAQYNTQGYTVKRLRAAYDISASDRVSITNRLPIELFHQMYVVSHIGLGQIAELFDTSRQTITALRDQYIASNHPLSTAIAETNNCGYYPRHLPELLQLLSKDELIESLRTKTIYEVAALQGLVPFTSNGLSPMTKDWLEAELKIKNEATIARENHITAPRLSTIMKELGVKRPSKASKLTEPLLRELYLNYCWSDQTIADHLGVSSALVRSVRYQYNILSDMRPSEAERIPPDLFHFLYVEEGMSLLQIGDAYSISDAKIRALKQKYIDDGHTDLQRRGAKVIPERLVYLNKLIHLNRLDTVRGNR